MTSRKKLYEFGETLGKSVTRKKLGGGLICGDGGGGGNSTSTSDNTTNNTDRRVAADSGGVGVSGDGNTVVNHVNSSDAVVAIAKAGADIIRESGGAIVELGKFQAAANTTAWDTTITNGSKLIDRLIDKVGDGFEVSKKVIDSFQPEANKQADSFKWVAIAVGGIAIASILGKK